MKRIRRFKPDVYRLKDWLGNDRVGNYRLLLYHDKTFMGVYCQIGANSRALIVDFLVALVATAIDAGI